MVVEIFFVEHLGGVNARVRDEDAFEAIENDAGRVVHAKWSWIVPPISGCAVTLFHKEHWQDIEVLPTYRPQADAWKEVPSEAAR